MNLPLTGSLDQVLNRLHELNKQIAITRDLILQLQDQILKLEMQESKNDFISKRFGETKWK